MEDRSIVEGLSMTQGPKGPTVEGPTVEGPKGSKGPEPRKKSSGRGARSGGNWKKAR